MSKVTHTAVRIETHPGWCDPLECKTSATGIDHSSAWTTIDLGDIRVTGRLIQRDDDDLDPNPEPFVDFSMEDLGSLRREPTNIIRGEGKFEIDEARCLARLIAQLAALA